MKALVCGGRDYGNWPHVVEVLDRYKLDKIIHGAARGVDTLAGCYAAAKNIPCRAMPADWKKNGRAAGPIRNQQMLDEEHPDIVIAFPGGVGTADMVRRAKAAHVLVVEVLE